MKKSLLATTFVAFPLFGRAARLKTYGCIAVVLLAGCMATQNRWQATQMRQQIMDYYNDQIMENLIRAKKQLAFVHVDVTSLTATDVASLTGTVGNGETTGSIRTSSGMLNVMGTLARTVSRPFSYSVTPARNTSLQIIASPVLGRLSADSEEASTPSPTPSPTPTRSPTPMPDFPASKVTTITGSAGQLEKTLTEFTPKSKPTPTPKPITIYTLYDGFVRKYDEDSLNVEDEDKGFCHAKNLNDGDYVPGTKKKWGNQYYYIKDTRKFRKAYYDFCKSLFTKGQAQSVEKTIEAKANAAAQAAEARILTQ